LAFSKLIFTLPLDGFGIVTFDSSKSTVDKVANA
jgi:hypothetical protein